MVLKIISFVMENDLKVHDVKRLMGLKVHQDVVIKVNFLEQRSVVA